MDPSCQLDEVHRQPTIDLFPCRAQPLSEQRPPVAGLVARRAGAPRDIETIVVDDAASDDGAAENEQVGPSASRADLTQYLVDLSAGNADAESPLLRFVYDELKTIAAASVRPRRNPGPVGESMAATALVHEAYLKLFNQDALDLKSRGHFFALAAKAMRQLLVDHARSRGRLKRGGGRQRQPLDDAIAEVAAMNIDLLDLEDALIELAEFEPMQAQVVEMRFFVGLEFEQIASALELTRHTVDRHWRLARAWLGHRLGRGSNDQS